MSLRLRNNGSGHHVQLVEFPNGATHYASDRVEWEETVASERPNFALANGHSYPPELSEKVRHALKPVFSRASSARRRSSRAAVRKSG